VIKEAMDKVEEMTREGLADTVYDVNDAGKIVRQPSGEHKTVISQVAFSPDVTCLKSFARAIAKYGDDDTTIWVGEACVKAVFQELGDQYIGYAKIARAEEEVLVLPTRSIPRCVLDVDLNPLFSERCYPKGDPQGAFCRKLSYDFAGATLSHDLLTLVRTMRWQSEDHESLEVRQGGDSMGKSVRKEAVGHDKFPDYVTVSFSAFESPSVSVTVSVKCQFVVDVTSRTLGLIPLPGEINRAKQVALEKLRFEVINHVGGGFEDKTFLGHANV
jgi:hypothetical protein